MQPYTERNFSETDLDVDYISVAQFLRDWVYQDVIDETLAVADREQLGGQVFSVVDSSVHGGKLLEAGFVLHVGVVETRVEHDDGKRQDVASVCSTHTEHRKPQLVLR